MKATAASGPIEGILVLACFAFALYLAVTSAKLKRSGIDLQNRKALIAVMLTLCALVVVATVVTVVLVMTAA